MKRHLILTGLCAILLFTSAAAAEPIAWQGNTVNGKQVSIPAKHITLAVFIRPGQKQSVTAMRYVKQLTGGANDLAVLVFISGPDAAMRAAAAAKDEQVPWPVVADPLFEASGAMGVHVWPTTLVINSAGDILAHVPSLPSTYLKDLEAHLDFARGRIDPIERDKRLTASDVIADSPGQMAARHLKIARQMLDRRRFDLARAELDKALKLTPDDPAVKLSFADLLSLLGEPRQALACLNDVPAATAPPWHTALIRGRALVRLNRHDDAAETLKQAVRLNPRPSEAWYLLGLAYQQQQNTTEAANAFRKAYETTTEGRSRATK